MSDDVVLDDTEFAPAFLVVKYEDGTDKVGPITHGLADIQKAAMDADPPAGYVSSKVEPVEA